MLVLDQLIAFHTVKELVQYRLVIKWNGQPIKTMNILGLEDYAFSSFTHTPT